MQGGNKILLSINLCILNQIRQFDCLQVEHRNLTVSMYSYVIILYSKRNGKKMVRCYLKVTLIQSQLSSSKLTDAYATPCHNVLSDNYDYSEVMASSPNKTPFHFIDSFKEDLLMSTIFSVIPLK